MPKPMLMSMMFMFMYSVCIITASVHHPCPCTNYTSVRMHVFVHCRPYRTLTWLGGRQG